MTIPKAFISYSHDSLEHKKWTLELATRLRASGVDAQIDQWDLRPGDDLAHFMETHLTAADRVLMVCTEKYIEKANAGTGGVGYEKMIVTASSLARIDSNKVIPLIRQSGATNVPTFLKSKMYLDFSVPDQFEFAFDELVRTLHDAPLYKKPPITTSPFPMNVAPAAMAKDAMKELMSAVIHEFDSNTSEFQNYPALVRRVGISRVLFDILYAEAIQLGYLDRHDNTYYRLLSKGKKYAIENGLVR